MICSWRAEPRESIRFLKLALEHDPANAELGLLLAEVYFHTKAYGNAMRCLNHVLATRPDHFEATFLTGLIQQRKGELAERPSCNLNARSV